jgi:hypothetical protein
LVIQSDREASLRTRGKGTRSSWGIQATASKAWASVKLRVIRSPVVRSAALWITAREPVASRGVHDLREGKTLKGVVQERLRYEIRPWNSICAETAGRLRKPESGPVVSRDSSRHKWSWVGDAVEGHRNYREGRIRPLTGRTVERWKQSSEEDLLQGRMNLINTIRGPVVRGKPQTV